MPTTHQDPLETLSLTLAEGLLRQTGELRFVARGASMLPAIYPGDEIIVHRAGLAGVKAGEVVLFRRQDRWFLHRVREILQGAPQPRLITQGDGLDSPDAPICSEELLGRAEFFVRNGRQRPLLGGCAPVHRVLRLAVRYVPHFAGACLQWQVFLAKCARVRSVLAALGRDKSQGAA